MAKQVKKKTVKPTKKVNKPKAKKSTTKKSTPKKSTSKAKKKVNKKPAKKVVKKQTTAKKKQVNKPKKSIFKNKKVCKEMDKWANITISESGEIIDKTGKLDAEIEKDRKVKEKKVSKGVIQKSLEAQTSKKSAKEGITFGEAGDGMYDEGGNWNGSTMTDKMINAIENPEERKLAQEIDKLQEEIRRARENDEDSYYIAQMVQELSRKRMQINELNHNYGDM